VQHISDLHSKFALGPHHVSKYVGEILLFNKFFSDC